MTTMNAAADATRTQPTDAPESPFTIEFATDVLAEIRQSALEAYRSLPYGGLEMGGVLFGRVSPSGHRAQKVEVEASRPMECDHAAGPAFILSMAERVRLTQLFEQARQEEELAALAVVGFWVSHGRSELGLTSHDAELYRVFFPHSWQICLALKPENNRPMRESLFCRVDGKVAPYQRPSEPAPFFALPVPIRQPEPSVQDADVPRYFIPDAPLDHLPVQQQHFHDYTSHEQVIRGGAFLDPALQELAEPFVPAPPPVKPPTAAELPRFQTDIYLPSSPPVEPPPATTWAKDLYRPAGRARALVQSDVPRLRSYWEKELEKEPEEVPRAVTVRERQPTEAEPDPNIPPSSDVSISPKPEVPGETAVEEARNAPPVEPPALTRSFGLRTVVLLMLAGVLLGGVLGYWFFGNREQVGAKDPGPELGLEMFNTGRDVLIHWDAKSPLVLNARAAELRIHDGNLVQTLSLDLKVLSKGYYHYQPIGFNLETTLIVTERDGRTEQSAASRFSK